MIELSVLYKSTCDLFGVEDSKSLGSALMKCVLTSNIEQIDKFSSLIKGDFSKDWLQMIFQYYQADRKEKKQDYTPKSIAVFLSRLISGSAETIDMCAGSGALTIQRWIENPDTVFELYEIDENVIPFLLFNLVLRNISAIVYQGDVLQNEIVKKWKISKGEKYGKVFDF